MTPLLTAWMASLVLITYRELPMSAVQQKVGSANQTVGYSKGGACPTYPLPAPIPAVYASSFVIFGALGVLATAERMRPIATMIGWGFTAAIALNLFGLGKNSCAKGQATSPTFASGLPAVPPGTPEGPGSSPTPFSPFPPPGSQTGPGSSPTPFAPFITTGP